MGWSNARRRVVLELDQDPAGGRAVDMARYILRRTQGVGLPVVLGAKGDPETSYGGSYAAPVQANIVGATNGIGSTTITRDLGANDISSGVTEVQSGAARTFANRLQRGRL